MLTPTFFMLSVLALPLGIPTQEAPELPSVRLVLQIQRTPQALNVFSERKPQDLPLDAWYAGGYAVDHTGQQLDARHELQQRVPSLVNHAADRLRTALGPAWQLIVTPRQNGITIRGPAGESQSATASSPNSMRLSDAVSALTDEFNESERAMTLPAGEKRQEAEAKASAAAARAQTALDELRVETIFMSLQSVSGEQAAAALRSALPWAAFSTVGNTQIVASGTARELAVARDLALRMDDAARQAMLEASQRARSSPAGRILAEPFTIDFTGGRLDEYLQLLSANARLTSWVVEDPRVQAAYIPAIQLTGVTVDSALMMLDGLVIATADEAQPVKAPLAVQRIDPAQGSDTPPIYRIGARYPDRQRADGRAPSPTQPRTELFNVFLDPEDPDDKGARAAWIKQAYETLLAAIETGVGMTGPSDSFKVKLHPPSGILFASGTPEELRLVNDIVQQWQSFH